MMTKLPTLIPYLTVQSAKTSIEFYKNAFGFEWINQHDGENSDHAEMKYKNDAPVTIKQLAEAHEDAIDSYERLQSGDKVGFFVSQ